MRDQEIIGLWEAYQQVHAQPEEYVDEIVERVADDTGETGRGPRLIDAYNKAPYSDDKDSAKNPIPIKLKRKGPKMKGVVRKEETDLFDYLLEYLVAEGYADTNKAALAIMANMSEDWKQSIVEAVGIVGPPKKAIDAIPGVRDLRIGLANTAKALDYGLNDPVRKVGKHVIPTERFPSQSTFAKTRPSGKGPVEYKDISGD